MKVVPKSNRTGGTKQNGNSTAADRSCAGPMVRRRAGWLVVPGLLLGAGLLQTGLVIGFHWEDWKDPQPVMTIWTPYDPASQQPSASPNPAPVQHGQRDAFYPPPGWDDGLFSAAQDRRTAPLPDAHAGQPSFAALLEFLNGLHMAKFSAHRPRTPGTSPEFATFLQASTSGR